MLAFSDIIDFLLRLMSDEAAQAQFEQDPQGTLEQAGLEGVTAQDIRDARLQLADSGAVSATDDGSGSSYPDGDDPVREIGYTTRHYAVDEDVRHDDDGGGADTFVTIDDRDTLFFQSISDDDVTVADNSVNIVTAVQDNDTTISDDDVSITADGSFNSDDDVLAIQDNSVDVDLDGPAGPPAPDVEEPDEAPSADLAAVSGPAEPEPEPEPTGTEADEPIDADLAADDSDALAV